MLLSAIRGLISGSITLGDALLQVIIIVPIILFSLTVHECSHGYMALLCGDPTARNMGRLTLNPIRHLDPIGALCMALFGFGWAKPVPVNTRYFKNPKTGMALTALAGPLSNILLAFICVILSGLMGLIKVPQNEFLYNVLSVIYTLFYLGAEMNVYLAVFNLIPIPPLDGSRILFVFLPYKVYFGVMKYERIIMIAMFALLYIGVFDVTLGWVADKILFGMRSLVGLVIHI